MSKGRGKEFKSLPFGTEHTEIQAVGVMPFWNIMGIITGDELFILPVGNFLNEKIILLHNSIQIPSFFVPD